MVSAQSAARHDLEPARTELQELKSLDGAPGGGAPCDASGMDRDHHAGREYLFDLGMAMGDALLVSVAQELRQGGPVLLDAERERIAFEEVEHPPRIGREPRQRIARHALLDQTRNAAVLGFQEGIIEAARHPRV